MENQTAYKIPVYHWLLFAGFLAILYLAFQRPIYLMVNDWFLKQEYSHASIIPFIAAFFVYQKRNELLHIEFNGSWIGFALTVLGLLLALVASMGTVYLVTQYATILIILGVIYTYVGGKAFKLIWLPLLVLAFVVPLPEFLFGILSQKLKLISSQIGVYVIRLFDISVFLEGNVIDLGVYKLQVVDACSGLRYLFPLMCFGFICAYIYNARPWQRILVFLTTIPITVFMNSFRIGMIGVLVNYWGIEQAEGFLHDFEGWVVFMACVGLLFLEMWFMAVILNKEKSLSEVFAVELPAPLPSNQLFQRRAIPKPLISLIPVLIIVVSVSMLNSQRTEVIPEREQFVTFPDQIGNWKGKRRVMEQIYVDALRGMTDYILSDYINEEGAVINYYAAYYQKQDASGSIHSPRNCIPGGGWIITALNKVYIDDVVEGKSLKVNRAIIEMAGQKQLTYYWFEQRGRNITNEYMAKWYQFIDSIMRNRTDGTLVRLVTPFSSDIPVEVADERLTKFLQLSYSDYERYMPD